MSAPRNEMSDFEKLFNALCTNLHQQMNYAMQHYNEHNKDEVWCTKQLNTLDANINSNADSPFKEQVRSMEAKLKAIIKSIEFNNLPAADQTKSNIVRNFTKTIIATRDLTADLLIDIIVHETNQEANNKKSEATQSAPNLRPRAGAARSQHPPGRLDKTQTASAPELRNNAATMWGEAKNPANKSGVVMGRKKKYK